VITYKTGGSPEAIDFKTGIVVELGDVVAMSNAIGAMRETPLVSSDCRKRAELLFDKNKCFEKYVSLFEKLTQK
jgi:glycosyltransferase involved in cell wall biosynthesis